MLKRDITYEDYNGNTVTEAFYFNLSKPELVEMEVEYPQGLSALIQSVMDAKDNKTLISLMKDLILRCYGQKSVDGKRFVKSAELRVEFSQTAAYEVLFMDLATNDSSAATFIKGILPRDMVADVDKMTAVVSPITSVPTT